MSNPEYSADYYDRLASWALKQGQWNRYSYTKKTGLFKTNTENETVIYEKFPVNTIEIWKATNRKFEFADVENITLTLINNGRNTILRFPHKDKNDMEMVYRVVARELGFVCLGIRSHLLPDIENDKFTKSELKEAHNTGGFLGGLLVGINLVGMVAEQTEKKLRKERELNDAWKVASAILIPINAFIIMQKYEKKIKDYSNIKSLFQVSDEILNVFLQRMISKIESAPLF